MGILGTALHLVGHQFDRIRQHPVGYSNYTPRRNRLGSDHIFVQGMIMDPSSSADFQKDQKVQSHPDAIQIHLEPSSKDSHRLHPFCVAISVCPSRGVHMFSRGQAAVSEFRTHHAAVLEVSAYYAGRWWWFGTPGGSRGSWWCVATRQVRRRRSWKRGRLGSSPVPEVPSQVTRWALCGLVQVTEVP